MQLALVPDEAHEAPQEKYNCIRIYSNKSKSGYTCSFIVDTKDTMTIPIRSVGRFPQ